MKRTLQSRYNCYNLLSESLIYPVTSICFTTLITGTHVINRRPTLVVKSPLNFKMVVFDLLVMVNFCLHPDPNFGLQIGTTLDTCLSFIIETQFVSEVPKPSWCIKFIDFTSEYIPVAFFHLN